MSTMPTQPELVRLHHVEPWLPELTSRLESEGIELWIAGYDSSHKPGEFLPAEGLDLTTGPLARGGAEFPEPDVLIAKEHVARAYEICAEVAEAARAKKEELRLARRQRRDCRECQSSRVRYLRNRPEGAIGRFFFKVFHSNQLELECEDCGEIWMERY